MSWPLSFGTHKRGPANFCNYLASCNKYRVGGWSGAGASCFGREDHTLIFSKNWMRTSSLLHLTPLAGEFKLVFASFNCRLRLLSLLPKSDH